MRVQSEYKNDPRTPSLEPLGFAWKKADEVMGGDVVAQYQGCLPSIMCSGSDDHLSYVVIFSQIELPVLIAYSGPEQEE